MRICTWVRRKNSNLPKLVHTRKNRYSSVVYVASMIDVAISHLKLRIFYPHRISCRIDVQCTLIYVSGSLDFILSFDQQYTHLPASLPILHILCSFPCAVSGSSKWRRWRNLHSANSYTHRICTFIIYLRVLNLLNRRFHFRRLTFFCISQKLFSSDLNGCWISISHLGVIGDSFEMYSVISPSRHFVLWVCSIQRNVILPWWLFVWWIMLQYIHHSS